MEGLSEALSLELAPLGIHATVVEPGFFRTDLLNDDSLVSTKLHIDDYTQTVGEMRDFATGASHEQPGDPARLAVAMLKLVDSPKPPVRLPLGTDTVARIEEKNRFVEAEPKEWHDVAICTDHV